MKLKSVTIRKMPGLGEFSIRDFGEGLNIIVGPNGIGKTSLCRAIRGMLWPSLDLDAEHRVLAESDTSSQWTHGEKHVVIERNRKNVTCFIDDRETSHKDLDLPDERAWGSFTIGIDDLMKSEGTESQIAAAIAREMAGGYDLSLITGPESTLFALSTREGSPQAKALREAVEKRQAVEDELLRIEEEERELPRLERELHEALEAKQELELLKKAHEIAEHREKEGALLARKSEFPETMAFIHEHDETTLEKLSHATDEAKQECARIDRLLKEAIEKKEAQRMTSGPLDHEEVHRWLAIPDTLQNLRTEVKLAETACAEALTRLNEARKGLTGLPEGEKEIPVTAELVARAEAYLGAVTAKRAELEHLKRLESWLKAQKKGGAPGEPGKLRDGIQKLVRWICSPEGKEALPQWIVMGVIVLLAISLIPAVTIALEGNTLGWSSIIASLAGIFTLYYVGRKAGGTREGSRELYRKEYEDTGLDKPADWGEEEVQKHYMKLSDDYTGALFESELKKKELELDERLIEVEKELKGLVEERGQVLHEGGIGAPDNDSTIVFTLRNLFIYQEALTGLAVAEEKRNKASEAYQEALSKLNEFLRSHHEEEAADNETASVILQRLNRRNEAYSQAEEQMKTLREEREKWEGILKKRSLDYESFFDRLGLQRGDKEAFTRLITNHGRWKEITMALTLDGEVIRRDTEFLAHHGKAALAALPRIELEERIAAAHKKEEQSREISNRAAIIRENIRKAREDSRLEAALAAQDEAEKALREARELALRKTAGRFLMDKVTGQYQREIEPQTLRSASELFRMFTTNTYALLVTSGDGKNGPSFKAKELSTGKSLSLSELSSGTRVQLFLAARLAFVRQAEKNTTLPFFLDEVLTTTDPVRFDAVAKDLKKLVADGKRQVFYITCDSYYIGKLRGYFSPQELTLIDLGKIRSESAAIGSEEFKVEKLPEAPPYEGKTAEEYARSLLVPKVNPFEGAAPLHLWYLLRHNLPLLYRLTSQSITTVGQYRYIRENLKLSEADQKALGELDQWIEAAERFFTLWHVGKGKVVDRAVIEESPVSKKFIDAITRKAAGVKGDGRLLMAALRTGAVAKFRHGRVEELESFLKSGGYLSEEKPLGEEALTAMIISDMGEALEEGLIDEGLLKERIHELWSCCTATVQDINAPEGEAPH
ncbi:MAG: AAA family ATPase [Candidatus Eremiobacteraeota bacterium]|nr:AAA family ATPase [Candidatus Eremiobacteraeota bacterium]